VTFLEVPALTLPNIIGFTYGPSIYCTELTTLVITINHLMMCKVKMLFVLRSIQNIMQCEHHVEFLNIKGICKVIARL